jgi:hypothetical protein
VVSMTLKGACRAAARVCARSASGPTYDNVRNPGSHRANSACQFAIVLRATRGIRMETPLQERGLGYESGTTMRCGPGMALVSAR